MYVTRSVAPCPYCGRAACLRRRPESLYGLGLGDLSSPQTINALATAGASTTLAIVTSLGLIAGPVGAALAGLVTVGSLIANQFHGCGQTCIAATQIVNQVEPILAQNLSTYLAAPVHYASMQAAALNNFDTAWAAVLQACSNPALQSAGKNCIADRQQGGCHYHTSPGGWQQSGGVWTYRGAGASGSGSTCWNWFVGYRDPIANDPTVVADPMPGAAAASSVLSAIGISPSTTVFGVPLSSLLLPAAGLAALALLWPED